MRDLNNSSPNKLVFVQDNKTSYFFVTPQLFELIPYILQTVFKEGEKNAPD
jgi:hypothetical protein